MPVVPFSPIPPQESAPQGFTPAQEPWMLMAAAQMDAQGRLIEKPAGERPSSKFNLWESRPHAAFGERSAIESNNPELGPTDAELERRKKERR